MVTAQLQARLKQIDVQIAKLHKQGYEVDVDTLLEKRFDIMKVLEEKNEEVLRPT